MKEKTAQNVQSDLLSTKSDALFSFTKQDKS